MREGRIPPHEAAKLVSSPFQDVVAILNTLFSYCPHPRVKTEAAKACGELLGRHILNLLGACGELNLAGCHSVAVSLFRPLEDALDLLAAVTMIAGAAERWQAGELKPSDAAALWIERGTIRPVTGGSFADYRKHLRSTFNPFSHCAPVVSQWDLFAETDPMDKNIVRVKVNHERYVIVSNAHRVDAYLVAHVSEFLAVVEEAYKEYFEADPTLSSKLRDLRADMQRVLAEHHKNGLLDTITPPELEFRSPRTKSEPAATLLAGRWQGSWSCGVISKVQGDLTLNQRHDWVTGRLIVRAAAGSTTHTITEQLSGTFEERRVLLDGTVCEMSPPNNSIRYQLDSFELILSDDGRELVGKHLCNVGRGEAKFIRAN